MREEDVTAKLKLFLKTAQKAPIRIAALYDLHHACHRAGRGNLPITACCNHCGSVSSSYFLSTLVQRVKVRWEAAAVSRTSHLGTLDSTGNAPSPCSISLSGFNVFSIKYHFSLTAVRSMKKINERSWTVWVWCSRGHTTDNVVEGFTEAKFLLCWERQRIGRSVLT